MKAELYFKAGRTFFGITVLAIGIIHFVAGHFPLGFTPVPAWLTAYKPLVYADGLIWAVAGAMLISPQYTRQGAILTGIIGVIMLLAVDAPLVIQNARADSQWAGAFEMVYFIAGALFCLGLSLQQQNAGKHAKVTAIILPLGRYLLAAGFFAFGIIHFKDEAFIENLLLPWMPFKTFFCWLVAIGYIAAFISFTINKLVWLSAQLVALMYLLWFLTLHTPLVATHLNVEPQWTSFFIALGSAGVALLAYCSVAPAPVMERQPVAV